MIDAHNADPEVILAQSQLILFADLLIHETDASELMAYSNNYQTVDTMIANYVARTDLLKKPGTGIIETGFIRNLPEAETLHYEFGKDSERFFQFIGDTVDKYGSLVVHDYMQYYYTLHEQYPE